jgi:hypothetical protein
VCNDPALRAEIKKQLQAYGVGEFSDKIMIDSVVDFCAGTVVNLLLTKFPALALMEEALTNGLVRLATMGLASICSSKATVPK